MTTKPENPAAFPYKETGELGNYPGMTLMDYFAARAMQTIIIAHIEVDADEGSELAYQWADAMLIARSKS
jgi:hypothetical protein